LLLFRDAPPNVPIEKDQFTVDRAGGGNAGVKSAVLERREEGDMGTTDSAWTVGEVGEMIRG